MRIVICTYISCLLLLAACSNQYHITGHSDKQYAVSNTGDSNMLKFLQPYKQSMDSQFSVILGRCDTILYKSQPECTLGNFMVDAMTEALRKKDATIEAGVFNYGGIRLPYIGTGDITLGKIFELMPFDNLVCIIDIPGDTMLKFCNHIAAYGGWPVNGIQFTIKDKQAQQIVINGKPLDTHKTYHIAVNDYIAGGGDNCSFFINLHKQTENILIRDILIAYIKTLSKQNRPLHPYIEKRIQNAG
ncbi:MAG: 5'-nucleotidase C-terminal domain-containing protein [Bacteroidetes bacterium]|nr:5'-nucleotidase C-terminal domain-containing protein [Bacteroidota bacterium]